MSSSPQRLLPISALLTALGASVALGAPAGHWLPAALWHIVFAVGALPMILAAMSYFVPVLTRSGEVPRWLASAPLTACAAGIGIVGYFLYGVTALRLVAPWIALLAVGGFSAWLAARWRHCLGRPNPCLAWYAAALGMLALGLLAVAMAPYWNQEAHSLRLLHLHLNTLGFMGLTALGTLHVLLPTVAGRPGPAAAIRLAADLKWSAAGTLMIGLGAAWFTPLAVIGVLAYALPVLRLMTHAWRTWRQAILAPGNTLPLLVAAGMGLCLVLGHGLLHAAEPVTAAGAVPLFVIAFLLPLVSGAAGHLLPIWLRPGVQNVWHDQQRRSLTYGARTRAALLIGGGLLAASGQAAGYALGIACALWLIVSLLRTAFSQPAR